MSTLLLDILQSNKRRERREGHKVGGEEEMTGRETNERSDFRMSNPIGNNKGCA